MRPILGADYTARDGKYVRKGRSTEKTGQDQSNGLHTGVRLGPTGIGGLQD